MDTSMQAQLSVVTSDQPVMVLIDSLLHADSPRLEGENVEHIEVLAGLGSELPPILVHRETMRVIDGMHRLRAAVQRGEREISARFFAGTDGDAFVAAVQANIGHGLPLSLADREGAAVRILGTHPQWSDRTIAEAVGLASTTVAWVRHRSADAGWQPDARIGKDGRVRPLNSAAGRRAAGRLFAERPDASLREVAGRAGISPATAKDVRDRLRRGEDPVQVRQAQAEERKANQPGGDRQEPPVPGKRRREAPDAAPVLQKLQRDPSLRLNENGRLLLRWLSSRSVNTGDWEGIEYDIPAHCMSLISDLALGFAEEWVRFAEALKDRAGS